MDRNQGTVLYFADGRMCLDIGGGLKARLEINSLDTFFTYIPKEENHIVSLPIGKNYPKIIELLKKNFAEGSTLATYDGEIVTGGQDIIAHISRIIIIQPLKS